MIVTTTCHTDVTVDCGKVRGTSLRDQSYISDELDRRITDSHVRTFEAHKYIIQRSSLGRIVKGLQDMGDI